MMTIPIMSINPYFSPPLGNTHALCFWKVYWMNREIEGANFYELNVRLSEQSTFLFRLLLADEKGEEEGK